MGDPQNGWFIMGNSIQMDELFIVANVVFDGYKIYRDKKSHGMVPDS